MAWYGTAWYDKMRKQPCLLDSYSHCDAGKKNVALCDERKNGFSALDWMID